MGGIPRPPGGGIMPMPFGGGIPGMPAMGIGGIPGRLGIPKGGGGTPEGCVLVYDVT